MFANISAFHTLTEYAIN